MEYASSKDATAARGKLHHSMVHHRKLEVHFDTKIPAVFHQMIEEASEAGSPTMRRYSSDDRPYAGSDYSNLTSPNSTEFRSGPPSDRQAFNAPRHGTGYSRGPASQYDSRRSSDRFEGTRPPTRGRNMDGPGGPGRSRYIDERVGPQNSARGRYMSRTPGSFRSHGRSYGPRGPRGGPNEYGTQNGRFPPRRGPYNERDGRNMSDYRHDEYQEYEAANGRAMSPPRKNHDSYRNSDYPEPQSASSNHNIDGSNADGNEQLTTPRYTRSRSESPERAHSTWNRSPCPIDENPIDHAIDSQMANSIGDKVGSFNEDSLFAAP
ncbi:hypothetical protein IWW36_001296 [Coemansia brasiliensis]|uniref:Uncharacterized protein n=1 Tax=Coemansia brasiliensis TaxID=2650707 RepID=A0A9W8LZ53_9FUNG|nr:hypothetical protein IWW36_001296 [Coemansia brasiliensis]